MQLISLQHTYWIVEWRFGPGNGNEGRCIDGVITGSTAVNNTHGEADSSVETFLGTPCGWSIRLHSGSHSSARYSAPSGNAAIYLFSFVFLPFSVAPLLDAQVCLNGLCGFTAPPSWNPVRGISACAQARSDSIPHTHHLASPRSRTANTELK